MLRVNQIFMCGMGVLFVLLSVWYSKIFFLLLLSSNYHNPVDNAFIHQNVTIFFLFLQQNTCCWCAHWKRLYERLPMSTKQQMFLLRNKKTSNASTPPLMWSYAVMQCMFGCQCLDLAQWKVVDSGISLKYWAMRFFRSSGRTDVCFQ